MLKTAQYELHLCIWPWLGNKVWSIGVADKNTICSTCGPCEVPETIDNNNDNDRTDYFIFCTFLRGNTVQVCETLYAVIQAATDNLSFTRGMGEGVASMITTPSPMGAVFLGSADYNVQHLSILELGIQTAQT